MNSDNNLKLFSHILFVYRTICFITFLQWIHYYTYLSCMVDAFYDAHSGPAVLIIQIRTLEECSVVWVFFPCKAGCYEDGLRARPSYLWSQDVTR